MAKWLPFSNFQALELILQPGSDDKLEVNHCESSNDSVEDEDFAEVVPKIDGNLEHETDEDKKLNDKPGANDGGEENSFVYVFQSSKKHVTNAADKQENFSKTKSEETLIFISTKSHVYVLCWFYILWRFIF